MKDMKDTNPFIRVNQIRCAVCKGLLYYHNGSHVNLSECEYISYFYRPKLPLRGTVGWQHRSTGNGRKG